MEYYSTKNEWNDVICNNMDDLEIESESHSVMSDSMRPHGLCSPWNFPGHNTGVGNLFLLQGIFPAQGSNPSISHCRQILLPAKLPGKPLEIVVLSELSQIKTNII